MVSSFDSCHSWMCLSHLFPVDVILHHFFRWTFIGKLDDVEYQEHFKKTGLSREIHVFWIRDITCSLCLSTSTKFYCSHFLAFIWTESFQNDSHHSYLGIFVNIVDVILQTIYALHGQIGLRFFVRTLTSNDLKTFPKVWDITALHWNANESL